MGIKMAKTNVQPLEIIDRVRAIGRNIHTARIRRRMTKEELAEKAGITTKTLYSIENGAPGVAIGHVLSVLWAMGLLGSANTLADPDQDEHGKILEAARRPQRARRVAQDDTDF